MTLEEFSLSRGTVYHAVYKVNFTSKFMDESLVCCIQTKATEH